MQNTPLGMHEETWENRNVDSLRAKRSWKKGYKAGKRNKEKENPYVLSSDVWEILRKRTEWELGYEDGYAARKSRKYKHKDRHEQLRHIEELSKKRKHKRHHKHD